MRKIDSIYYNWYMQTVAVFEFSMKLMTFLLFSTCVASDLDKLRTHQECVLGKFDIHQERVLGNFRTHQDEFRRATCTPRVCFGYAPCTSMIKREEMTEKEKKKVVGREIAEREKL